MNAELYDVPALICKINEENKRLRELAFARCSLHGKAFGNTENCQDMFIDGKCEGYCRSDNDDEPLDVCKECIIHEYYESEATK